MRPIRLTRRPRKISGLIVKASNATCATPWPAGPSEATRSSGCYDRPNCCRLDTGHWVSSGRAMRQVTGAPRRNTKWWFIACTGGEQSSHGGEFHVHITGVISVLNSIDPIRSALLAELSRESSKPACYATLGPYKFRAYVR